MRKKDINLDFNVLETDNIKVLSVIDTSIWSVIEDQPSIIEIQLPGSKEKVIHYFSKNAVNNFNSINLGLNCIDECEGIVLNDLPDGIYTITLKGSPSEYFIEKEYIRLNKIKLELDKKIIQSDMKGCGCNHPLFDVEMLLKSAEANVRYNNSCQASEDYEKAKKLLNKCK